MTDPAKARTLADLRARLAPQQAVPRETVLPRGVQVQRGQAAGLGLARGRVHEFLPDRPGHGAAMGLAARYLAAAQGAGRPVLWVATGRDRSQEGRLYAPGLAQAGLDPAGLICVTPRRPDEVLWVLEEALGSGALAALAAWIGDLDLTPSRRLSLAAERTGTPLFLIRPYRAAGATAAETRWRVTPRPSAPHPFDAQAPGRAVWHLDLIRARTTSPGTWEVICDDPEDALDLAAPLRDRTPAPPLGAHRRRAGG